MKKVLKSISLSVLFTLGVVSNVCSQSSVRDEFPTRDMKGVRYEYFTKEDWDSSNYASPEVMKEWQDRRYGMFITFGITSKLNKDLSWGSIPNRYAPDAPSIMANGQKRTENWTTWGNDMKLEKYDAKEWVAIAKRAGFKYMVVITKHHEGFHMWDTSFSDFKITNTPFGRDYLKELVDACHEANMPIGFYFAQREWYHPDYQPLDLNKVKTNGLKWKLNEGETSPLGSRHPMYLDYMRNVIKELCTKYGKIDMWWWDAVSWEGMFTKEMWDAENVTRMIRDLQPGIVINNRASIPGDYDTPEGHLGAFQDWRPWETCIPIADGWSYTGKPARSFEHLLHLVAGAACGNGNLLPSWGPHWDGAFDEDQKKRLFEIGDWLQLNGESIYGTRGGPWKPTSWGGATKNGNKAYIHLFKRPAGTLVLPIIPNRKVVGAKMLVGGEKVLFKQNKKFLTLTIPGKETIVGDLVVELTMNESLDGLPSITVEELASSFAIDQATYGSVISRNAAVQLSSRSAEMPVGSENNLVKEDQINPFAIKTNSEATPFAVIDLGKAKKVTGVFVKNAENTGNKMATLNISVSLDGKEWSEVLQSKKEEKSWEVKITNFVSGAMIPGRQVRFIRLQTHPKQPESLQLKQVEVWGK